MSERLLHDEWDAARDAGLQEAAASIELADADLVIGNAWHRVEYLTRDAAVAAINTLRDERFTA